MKALRIEVARAAAGLANGSFPAVPRTGNSNRVLGLFDGLPKGVVL